VSGNLGTKGIYNCRPPRGGGGYSVHAEGRAVDLTANAHDTHQRALADDYVNWLIENDDELGVQRIIWNHRVWTSGGSWKPYTNKAAGPHTDHLHVELNRDGAATVHPLLTGNGPIEEDDLTPEQDKMLQTVNHNAGQAVNEAGAAKVEAAAAKGYSADALRKVGEIEKAVAGIKADIRAELDRDRAERAILFDAITNEPEKWRAETVTYAANLKNRPGG
jgi:hypothetical protein